MKTFGRVAVVSAMIGAGVFGATTVSAPKAHACTINQVTIAGNGGGYCDNPAGADGTWIHCESVYVLGFGGQNCFRVRPVGTDIDPRGWTPA